MDAELYLECSKDLLLLHSEGSRTHIHHYRLLKLLATKNFFLRSPSIQRGSKPGTRKADAVVGTSTNSSAEYLTLAFGFPTYKLKVFIKQGVVENHQH